MCSPLASTCGWTRRRSSRNSIFPSVHPDNPIEAVKAIPPGRWTVGVSGGVDSVALLELARQRDDLQLHVVHLNHETRGGASAEDAQFVEELAAKWNLPCATARLSEIELREKPSNTAARFRAARFALFKRVAETNALRGVLLAHHADDQAETAMQRLLRGSGPPGLRGMPAETTIAGLLVHRPLLGVSKTVLQALLVDRGIAWREDASNRSPAYQRNRVRTVLSTHPQIAVAAIELADTCRTMLATLRAIAPTLGEAFDVSALNELPLPLARESARRWLGEHAGADVEIAPAAIERLLQMANDAASPPRQHFSGKLLVRRKSGKITAATSKSSRGASRPSADDL